MRNTGRFVAIALVGISLLAFQASPSLASSHREELLWMGPQRRLSLGSVGIDLSLPDELSVDVDVVEERSSELVGTTGGVLPFVEDDEDAPHVRKSHVPPQPDPPRAGDLHVGGR